MMEYQNQLIQVAFRIQLVESIYILIALVSWLFLTVKAKSTYLDIFLKFGVSLIAQIATYSIGVVGLSKASKAWMAAHALAVDRPASFWTTVCELSIIGLLAYFVFALATAIVIKKRSNLIDNRLSLWLLLGIDLWTLGFCWITYLGVIVQHG